jgi:predicted small metal-binding protein
MARMVFECARVPVKTGKTCTLQLAGDPKDVLPAAKQHLASAHGMRGKKIEDNLSQLAQEHAKKYSTWV